MLCLTLHLELHLKVTSKSCANEAKLLSFDLIMDITKAVRICGIQKCSIGWCSEVGSTRVD